MNVVDDGAIKLTLEKIRSPVIFRHGKTARVDIVLEHQVRGLNKFDARCGRQVEAIAQIDDGSDNVWLRDSVGATFSEFLKMLRPVQRSCWVRFPEIDARPKPIVVIFAYQKRLVLQKILSNGTVASVIAEDKRRSKLVHLTQTLGFGGDFD